MTLAQFLTTCAKLDRGQKALSSVKARSALKDGVGARGKPSSLLADEVNLIHKHRRNVDKALAALP